MRREDPMDHLALVAEDITLALRPYGIDPSDPAACAETLRNIADALAPGAPAVVTWPSEPQLRR
jgi:hypothetical protein